MIDINVAGAPMIDIDVVRAPMIDTDVAGAPMIDIDVVGVSLTDGAGIGATILHVVASAAVVAHETHAFVVELVAVGGDAGVVGEGAKCPSVSGHIINGISAEPRWPLINVIQLGQNI